MLRALRDRNETSDRYDGNSDVHSESVDIRTLRTVRYINDRVRRFQKQHQPTISVDTKKKELVGDFKNPG